MKRLVFLLALAAPLALAQSTWADRLQAECDFQMALGVCKVENDASDYPPGTSSVLIAGVGRVPLATYLRVRSAGPQMCSIAAQYCRESPAGDECKVARAFWGS